MARGLDEIVLWRVYHTWPSSEGIMGATPIRVRNQLNLVIRILSSQNI